MDIIGLDLHQRETQVGIVDESGAIQLERRIPTTRAAFSALLGRRAPAHCLLEAGTESEWVAQCLEQLGHEVVVADPNYAPMYATRRPAAPGIRPTRRSKAGPPGSRPAGGSAWRWSPWPGGWPAFSTRSGATGPPTAPSRAGS